MYIYIKISLRRNLFQSQWIEKNRGEGPLDVRLQSSYMFLFERVRLQLSTPRFYCGS